MMLPSTIYLALLASSADLSHASQALDAAPALIPRSNDSTTCIAPVIRRNKIFDHCDEHGHIHRRAPLTSNPTSTEPAAENCARTCIEIDACQSFGFLNSTSTCTFFSEKLTTMRFVKKNTTAGPAYWGNRCWQLTPFVTMPLFDGDFEHTAAEGPSPWTLLLEQGGVGEVDAPGDGVDGSQGAYLHVATANDFAGFYQDLVSCPGSVYALEYDLNNPGAADTPFDILLNGIFFDRPQLAQTDGFVHRSGYFTTSMDRVYMLVRVFAPYNYTGGEVGYYVDNFNVYAVDGSALPPGTVIIQAQ